MRGGSAVGRGRLVLGALVAAALASILPTFAASVRAAEGIPSISELPAEVSATHPELARERADLVHNRDALRARVSEHNTQCRNVAVGSVQEGSCRESRQRLGAEMRTHVEQTDDFNRRVQSAALGTGSTAAGRVALAAPSGWKAGLDCAMGPIYERAESYGAEGRQFAAELRAGVEQVRRSAGPTRRSGDPNDADVASLDLNRQLSLRDSGRATGGQFIVDVLVVAHGDGTTSVNVQSSLQDASGKKHDEQQSIMLFGADGKLAKAETTPSPVRTSPCSN